jgi:hypothetical protein
MVKQQFSLCGTSAGGLACARAAPLGASPQCTKQKGNRHVFPLKDIDTLGRIRHLHVSRSAGGGKNPD